jgi:hypothetical protein
MNRLRYIRAADGSYYAVVVEVKKDSLIVDKLSKRHKQDPTARREIKREEIKEVWDIDLLSDSAGRFRPTKGRKLYERKK